MLFVPFVVNPPLRWAISTIVAKQLHATGVPHADSGRRKPVRKLAYTVNFDDTVLRKISQSILTSVEMSIITTQWQPTTTLSVQVT